MQQAQQREQPERMSWARAMIFAVGFFFIAALLIGQIPSYIYAMMTSASLVGLEQGSLALALVFLGGFAIIQVIVLLFDPKPVVPPMIFTMLGAPLALAGLALVLWAVFTGNQAFPHAGQSIASILGGNFLWFQPDNIDLVVIGLAALGVGVALVFYSQLALREQRNPDRSDPGTTPAIRFMIVAAVVMLILFLFGYTLFSDQGLAYRIDSGNAVQVQLIIDSIVNTILGVAVFLTLGAFALRLHYLMRPVRKRTMSGLYAVGALGLAQTGVIFLLVWLLVYPVLAWMHTWSFIGLGDLLTICSRKTAIPASCSFAPQAGYIIDTVVSGGTFTALFAAIWAWRSKRNLVVIGSVTITAVLALATLLVHVHPDEISVALMLCIGALVLAAVWTSVARREFAVVGENNLGCLGMWLVVGTSLFIYLASFAFFSIPAFNGENEPNVTFIPGSAIPAHPASGAPTLGQADAVVMLAILGILAAIQFYFLIRNRYKV